MEISQKIKSLALEAGFCACGIAPAEDLVADGEFLQFWLEGGNHGSMRFLENYQVERRDIRKLVAGAKSVIVVLENYFTAKRQPSGAPKIARYALGNDYHYEIRRRLGELLSAINQRVLPCNGRAFCDSAPVFERRLAQRAGLGFIGRNRLLINPDFGSFCLIGVLVVDAVLPYDEPSDGDCGDCRKCLTACPGGALRTTAFDARKCLSFLTIEKREILTADEQKLCGNRLFGCDVCQDVCPFNAAAKEHSNPFFLNENLLNLTPEKWQNLTRSEFKILLKNSPLQRAGYRKIRQRLDFFFNKKSGL